MKIGIVGLDTSHCGAFTAMLNDAAHQYHIPGARVTAAFPGGSQAFSLSRQRVQGYTDELKHRYGVAMCDSIAGVVRDVDAILLESVDGRQHLQQFRELAVGKPVFIDKPLTTSTADARLLIDLARATSTPVMSCSALRFAAGVADLVTETARDQARIASCEAFGPAEILEDYPGLFWYGIHSAEMLFALMGRGCRTVRCVSYDQMDIAGGAWSDGRVGVMKGTRLGRSDFGCVAHTASGTRFALALDTPPFYYLLLQQIIAFLASGRSPVDLADTFEIIAFIEAADKSKSAGGLEVGLEAL
jgi:predicted dehydrogenase